MSVSQSQQNGFTLNELMIVVSVIVIIATLLLQNVNPFQQFLRGYDTIRKSDLAKLKTAFENYYNDHDCYPSPSVLSQCGSSALAPYLDLIPCDPDGVPYNLYTLPNDSTCPQKYAIYANVSAQNDAQADDIYYCPNTIAVKSGDMAYTDVIMGCSGNIICKTLYGCINGACVVIAEDSIPTCSPNSCDPTCGVDCTKKNRRGAYTNECRAI